MTLKWLMVALCSAVMAVHAEPQPVARVAIAVGTAQLVTAGGRTGPLVLGTQLSEQDRIITGRDAMVVLVFSDQGRVSVRPDSELVIRRYHIDPSGVDTQLQLELVRGAVRQISGQAAHAQPERYRLSTPIAAIGVRGTDFLAKVGNQSVETYVHEGMIVLLPVNAAAGQTGVPMATLSASDAGQYMLVRSEGKIERRNVTPEEVERIFGIRLNSGAKNPSLGDSPTAAAGLPPDGSTMAADRVLHDSLIKDNVTSPIVNLPALPTQLVWGRFTDPLELPFQVPVSYADASNGRHVTVGELGQYALWRANSNNGFDAGLRGQVSFALAAGEAYLQQNAQITPVSISQSQLTADFDQMRFNTQLALSAPGVATASLNVGGKIADDGLFIGVANNQRVAGAFSRNGQEAGYLFSINAGLGRYQGITLWSAK